MVGPASQITLALMISVPAFISAAQPASVTQSSPEAAVQTIRSTAMHRRPSSDALCHWIKLDGAKSEIELVTIVGSAQRSWSEQGYAHATWEVKAYLTLTLLSQGEHRAIHTHIEAGDVR